MTLKGPIRVDTILGSSADSSWADRLQTAEVDVLRLDQADAQKSRLRRTTSGGTEVAISLDRGTQLRDGDVLYWDSDCRTAIVARVDLNDVMVIDLSVVGDRPWQEAMAVCVQLGHALGNQHWAAVVKGLQVYVPLTIARAVMASVMNTHAFEGVSYTFAPGAEVAAHLTPDQARRLFGAAAGHHRGGEAR